MTFDKFIDERNKYCQLRHMSCKSYLILALFRFRCYDNFKKQMMPLWLGFWRSGALLNLITFPLPLIVSGALSRGAVLIYAVNNFIISINTYNLPNGIRYVMFFTEMFTSYASVPGGLIHPPGTLFSGIPKKLFPRAQKYLTGGWFGDMMMP